MIYVATPYSHDDPVVRDFRFRAVTLYTADLYKRHVVAYSPITHGHPMTILDPDMPKTWQFWREMDFHHLRICDDIHVLQLDGWDSSVGVAEEITMAKQLSIRITYIAPTQRLIEMARATMSFT